MQFRMFALAMIAASSASCALVMGYGDYREEAPITTTTSASGNGGSTGNGSSTASGTGGNGGSGESNSSVGSTGGAGPGCADGGAPSIEICGNDVDEDCDGVVCKHVADWSRRYTDTGLPALDRAITAVAAVNAETAVAGWYNGTLDLGSGFTRADSLSPGRELFAARLATNGSTKALSPAPPTVLIREATGVALSAMGTHLAVTGFVETGTANLRDLFVYRAAPPNLEWTKQIGSTGQDKGGLVAFDSTNNVLVASTLTPGPGVLACAGGDLSYATSTPQLVVAKLAASDGSCLWARSFAAPTIFAQGLLVDASGQVIVVGAYKGDIAGTPVGTSGGPGTFVLALDPSTGATAWSKAFPVTDTMSFASPTGVAAGTAGRLYISGSLVGTATFGATMLSSTTAGQEDALVIALDGSAAGKGELVWAHRFGGTNGLKRATAIGVVPHAGGDDLFVAGIAAGAMSVEPDSDTGVLCPLGGVFLLKLRDEAPVWGDCFGEGGVEATDIVHMASSGTRLVLVGARKLPIDFGQGVLAGQGTFDAFAAQLTLP